MLSRIRHPSPAMVVAVLALFFALGGVAGAVTAVPLAKRALSADNAKKLQGMTLAQIAATPGPFWLENRADSVTLAPGQESYVTIACDADQSAISGGFSTSGVVLAADSFPVDASSWQLYLINLNLTAPASVNLYVVCADARVRSTTAARAAQADATLEKSSGMLDHLQR